jgi:protease IV
MKRIFLLLALLPAVTGGCRCHPLQVKTESRVAVDALPTVPSGPICETSLGPCGKCQAKVAVIDVDGLLLNMDMTGLASMGENPVAVWREKLDAVAADPCVKAVVVRINSPGGGVTASDIMWHDLVAFRLAKNVPTIACLMDVGTGGAYYLATGCDRIVAHPTTVTGGIGVILNLYNLQDMMAQFNVLGVPIKSGQYVDLGSPIRPMSDDGRKLLQGMADQFHARFSKVVQDARPSHNPAQTEDFDGRVFTAQQAFDRGLIDQIGYLDDAIQMARQTAGLKSAATVLFHRANDTVHNAYSVTPNVPLQASLLPVSIPGMERSKLPTFLYLWQPEPTLERLGGR